MKKSIFSLICGFLFFSSVSNATPLTGLFNHSYVYVLSFNGLSACRVDDNDGTLILPCTRQDLTQFNFILPSHITIIPGSNYAYISAETRSVVRGRSRTFDIYLCNINDENGLFTKCQKQSSYNDNYNSRSQPEGMAVDSTGTVLYVTNIDYYERDYRQKMVYCSINQENASLSSCRNMAASDKGMGITLANYSPYLYYITLGKGSYSHSSLVYCKRDLRTNIAQPQDCKSLTYRFSLLALVTDAVNWDIYFTAAYSGKIYSCMLEADGSPYDCKLAYDIKNLPEAEDHSLRLMSIATTPFGQYVYVGDYYQDRVYFCKINYSNRTFSKCIAYHDDSFGHIISVAYR